VPLFVISGVPASGKTTVSRLVHLVFLDPGEAAVANRDRGRSKTAYGNHWDVGELREVLRVETARLGLWLDSTELSAEQTVDRILGNLGASLVRLGHPPAPG